MVGWTQDRLWSMRKNEMRSTFLQHQAHTFRSSHRICSKEGKPGDRINYDVCAMQHCSTLELQHSDQI